MSIRHRLQKLEAKHVTKPKQDYIIIRTLYVRDDKGEAKEVAALARGQTKEDVDIVRQDNRILTTNVKPNMRLTLPSANK